MKDAPERPQFTLWQLMSTVAFMAALLAIAMPLMRWMAAQSELSVLFSTALVVAAVVPGLVIGLGIRPLCSNSTKAATRAEVLSHGVGACGIVVLLFGVVSGFVALFREYEMDLPSMTQHVVFVNYAATRHLELAILLVMVFILIDVVVFAFLHATESRRSWARIWSGSISLLLLIVTIVSLVALLLPAFQVLSHNAWRLSESLGSEHT